jgi:hypothetical protein
MKLFIDLAEKGLIPDRQGVVGVALSLQEKI